MNSQPSQLELDALVRSLAVNRGKSISLLLGAGASISSGMPSAERCIWDWKQDIFATNNPALRESVGEISLAGTRRRIQDWLDRRGGYPPNFDPSEYSVYAQACFPTSTDRRSYFQNYVRASVPFIGYRLLPLLARAGLIRSLWTTNFDGLPARACAAGGVSCFEIGIDSQHRIALVPATGDLRVVSLHGDYRYDQLKNTTTELQSQEAELLKELVADLREHDLLVIGYSGRDTSLMSALMDAYAGAHAGRLYWCGMQPEPLREVQGLLDAAVASGCEAFYVPSGGFDDLMERIALRILSDADLQSAKDILAVASKESMRRGKFLARPEPASTLVKSNAYPLTIPKEVIKVDLRFPPGIKSRTWLDGQMKQIPGAWVTVPSGGLMLTPIADMKSALGPSMMAAPVALAISTEELTQSTQIQSLMRQALVHDVAKCCLLETDGRRVWEPASHEIRLFDRQSFAIHRALSLRLAILKGKVYVLLSPDVVAKSVNGEIAGEEATKVLRNAVYGYQHNDVFDADLKRWTSRITNVEIADYRGQHFFIGKTPLYAGLFQPNQLPLSAEWQRFSTFGGFVVEDAKLIFSSKSGQGEAKDANPLKGLVQNRPWDYSVTSSGLSTTAEVAAICPADHARNLERFLCQLSERSDPNSTELDYLQPFPGFAAAFSLPIVHARPGEATWQVFAATVSGSPLQCAKQIARAICASLDRIRSLNPSAISFVFVPSAWAPYEVVEEAGEHFNLHDYVKAYAARNGQSTQFLRETKVVPNPSCRLKWWLSLALYAKAMRTPWRLDCLDDDSAFVGIGYSIDSQASTGNQILLGCSHIYSARGEGLQFRLGRIEHPIIRGRNPYMSLDDARRTGETIRQLFFDARMRLPKRVVIHKRTRFTLGDHPKPDMDDRVKSGHREMA